jgi:GMP synthase (glutamine-hydrolysing)
MHVLVLQHAPVEGSGAIGEALRARGIHESVVRTYQDDPVPRDLGDARGLLVMGGPMGVYEADRFPHLRDEIRLVERAIAKGVPVLGVCLGSQLVAAALGARVYRAPKSEIGWREVRFREAADEDAMWSDCPRVFSPLHWHGDVFELPASATALASSGQTEHQAFRFGASTWGVLFHAEVDRLEVEAMADAFPEDLGNAGLTRADLTSGIDARLAEVAPIAARAFGAWGERVLRTAP